MSEPHLVTSIDGHVATMEFNRPEKRNALSVEMLEAMTGFVEAIASDPQVRCLVMSGRGGHFMSGGDVGGFAEALDQSPDQRAVDFARRARRALPVFAALERFPGPIVAKVRGAVAGAGVGWVAAADIVLVSDTALFVFAHVHLGLSPDGGVTHFLPRLVGPRRAAEWLLLGKRIDAAAAVSSGLATRLVANDDLDRETQALVEQFAQGPVEALARTRRLLVDTFAYDRVEQMEREAAAFGGCAASSEFVTGVRGFLDRGRPAAVAGKVLG